MMGLTRKQAELLAFIREYNASHPNSPSFDEMQAALQLASKSGVHRLVVALEERGAIRRTEHRARSIVVVDPRKALVEVVEGLVNAAAVDGQLRSRGAIAAALEGVI